MKDAALSFSNRHRSLLIGIAIGSCVILVLLAWFFWDSLSDWWRAAYVVLSDREAIKAFVQDFGAAGPFVFVAIQIGQVLLAPIPGEATGFIGGYLFGTGWGFVYSSIGLTLGSWLNFGVGRFLGKRVVSRMIPDQHMQRLNKSLKRQGALFVFFLFLFPGFPKDYLSLFLGITSMPIKLFLIMATVGRMPGTLMLSVQGALLYEGNYRLLLGSLLLCGMIGGLAYIYKEKLYRWIEKFNQT